MDSLFVPALQEAGYEAVTPVMSGAYLIHDQIVKHLEQADLVLCDLSQHNPNVFFELGVRTSLDKPIALVRDEFTEIPFDTGAINTYAYSSSLRGWEIENHRRALAAHVQASAESCAGRNPLWQKFGLTLRAQEPIVDESPAEAKFDLLRSEVSSLAGVVRQLVDRDGVDGASLWRKPTGGTYWKMSARQQDEWMTAYQAVVRDRLKTGDFSLSLSLSDTGRYLTIAVAEDTVLRPRAVTELKERAEAAGLDFAITALPEDVLRAIAYAEAGAPEEEEEDG